MTVTVTQGTRKYEWRKGLGWYSDKNRRVTSLPLIKKLDALACKNPTRLYIFFGSILQEKPEQESKPDGYRINSALEQE